MGAMTEMECVSQTSVINLFLSQELYKYGNI